VGNILSINFEEIGFIGSRFRPKIFDIGFPVLILDSTASDGDGIRKNEEDTDTREDDVQIEKVTKNIPQSIDDLLIPSTGNDLSALAENSYYSRKTVSKTSISDYISPPYIPGTTLSNPDSHSIQKPIEFTTIPYPISYIIDRSGSDYAGTEEYSPSRQTQTYIHESEPRAYTLELEIFDPALMGREEPITYTQSTQVYKIGNMYDTFSFNSSDSSELSVIEPLHRIQTSDYSTPSIEIQSLEIPEIRPSTEYTQTHKVTDGYESVSFNSSESSIFFEIKSTTYSSPLQVLQALKNTEIRTFDLPIPEIELSNYSRPLEFLEIKTSNQPKPLAKTSTEFSETLFNYSLPRAYTITEQVPTLEIKIEQIQPQVYKHNPSAIEVYEQLQVSRQQTYESSTIIYLITSTNILEIQQQNNVTESIPLDDVVSKEYHNFPVITSIDLELTQTETYVPNDPETSIEDITIDLHSEIKEQTSSYESEERQIPENNYRENTDMDQMTRAISADNLIRQEITDDENVKTLEYEIKPETSDAIVRIRPITTSRTPYIQPKETDTSETKKSEDTPDSDSANLIDENYNFEQDESEIELEYTNTNYNVDSSLMEIIKSKFKNFENDYGGAPAINIVDASTSEKIFSINSDEILSLGSTPKIAIVRAFLEWSKKKDINLEDEIAIRNSLKPKNYGDGNDKVTYIDLMNEIIKDSNGRSNAYTNFLIDQIGLRKLNKIIHDLGYNDTTFVDYYLPRSNHRGNTSSLNDVSKMMLDILNGEGLDEKHHKIALQILGSKMTYVIGDSQDLEGVNMDSIMVKHGQSERDMTILYRVSGEENGRTYDRVVSITLSGLKQRFVKGDFKTPTSFGRSVYMDLMDIRKEVIEMAKTAHTNQ